MTLTAGDDLEAGLYASPCVGRSERVESVGFRYVPGMSEYLAAFAEVRRSSFQPRRDFLVGSTLAVQGQDAVNQCPKLEGPISHNRGYSPLPASRL